MTTHAHEPPHKSLSEPAIHANNSLPARKKPATSLGSIQENPTAAADPRPKARKISFLRERLLAAAWPFPPLALAAVALLPYASLVVSVPLYWMLPASLLGLGYLHNLVARHARKRAIQLSTDPRIVKVITKHLPTWFTDSEVEPSKWLSLTIRRIWPQITELIEMNAPETVKPILDYLGCKRPAFIDDVRLTRCWLGTIPLEVHGVRFVKTTDEVVQLDVDVSWAGDSELFLEVGYKGMPLALQVSKIVLRGRVRLELGPLAAKMPIFSAVSLTFMEEPFLDFSIHVLKLNVAAVGMPDLSIGDTVAWVIRECVFRESTYYPSRLVIPIHDHVDRNRMARFVAQGRLGITIVSAKKLKAADLWGLSDPYVKVSYAPKQQVFRTKVKPQTLEPKWDEEFWIDVYDPEQSVLLEVKDHDVVGKAEPIGIAHVVLKNLPAMEQVEMTLPLKEVETGEVTVRVVMVPSVKAGEEKDLDDELEAIAGVDVGIDHDLHANGIMSEDQVLIPSSDVHDNKSPSPDDAALDTPGRSVASNSRATRRLSGATHQGVLHLANPRLVGYASKGGLRNKLALRFSIGNTTQSTDMIRAPCIDPIFKGTMSFHLSPRLSVMDVVIVESGAMAGSHVLARTSIDLGKLTRRTGTAESDWQISYKNKSYRLHFESSFAPMMPGGATASNVSSPMSPAEGEESQ